MNIPVFADFTIPSESYQPEWLEKTINSVFDLLSQNDPSMNRFKSQAVSLNLVLNYIVYAAGFRSFPWDTISESPFIDELSLEISDTFTSERYLVETFNRIKRELIKLTVEGKVALLIKTLRPDGVEEYNFFEIHHIEPSEQLIGELYKSLVVSNIPNIYISYRKLPPIT